MKTMQNENLRIIWAITAKDIVDGLKNRSILSSIFTALFLVVFYRGLPLLTANARPPVLGIYDAGDSQLAAALETNPEVDPRTFSSQEDFERFLGGETTPILGISFPEGIDEMLQENQQITISGYAPHWLSDSAIEKLHSETKTILESTTRKTINLEIQSDAVLTNEKGGLAFFSSLAIVVVMFLFGLSITPTLMLEEKQSQTIDALIVSPASSTHIVIGKALTGLIYSLIGGTLVLIFNVSFFVHCGIIITCVILGALFHVAIGLLFGAVINNKQQLGTWTVILAQPLLLPVAFVYLGDLFPDLAQNIMAWIPTVALGRAIRDSLLAAPSTETYALALLYVFAITLALLAWVVLVIRNRDRV